MTKKIICLKLYVYVDLTVDVQLRPNFPVSKPHRSANCNRLDRRAFGLSSSFIFRKTKYAIYSCIIKGPVQLIANPLFNIEGLVFPRSPYVFNCFALSSKPSVIETVKT